MELKEGMYIRTKITDNCNCVYIRQITEIETDVEKAYRNQICIDEDVIDGWGDDRIWVDVKDISKASHNIIDLIEVGDYVNGFKITSIEEGNRKNKWVYAEDEDGYLIKSFAPKKIKSIVTKEQFESISYEVSNERRR